MPVDIVGTIGIIIRLGIEIKNRLDSLDQAAEDLQLLISNLSLLLKLFENPINNALIKTHVLELACILDILQSIALSCTKCAKALDVETTGATNAANKAQGRGQKFINRLRAFSKVPDLLAEIQRKATHLQQIYTAVSALTIQEIRLQQERTKENETIESTSVVEETASFDLDLGTNFASIDHIVGNLLQECKQLRQRLQEAVLVPDTSYIQAIQAQNPEAVSFWRDRFQRGELNASTLRYEVMKLSTSSSRVPKLVASY